MDGEKQDKLSRLALEYGLSQEELVVEFGTRSLVPGICMNGGCDYTREYEPEEREGWCEECDTRSVQSALVLVGLI